MTTRKCKKCGTAMTLTSYEAAGQYEIHTHYVCNKNPDHPFYCTQERRWIGS